MLASMRGVSGQTYTIGDNDGANTTTTYPTPFGDFYKTQRAQYLYHAAEMAMMGMGAGDITSVAFTVTAPYIITDLDGGVTEGYTIKILSTATTSLGTTTWEEGATTVWGPMDYIPVEGVNTFTLDIPFYWDGSSNLIVEICGGVPEGNWEENALVIWTTGLAFNGSRTWRSDVEVGICGYTGVSTFGIATNRPQIIFGAEPAVDCEGMPEAGSATATMETVCPDDVFSVSVDPVFGGGITYQWAASTDGIIFNDIIGATGPTYTTTQTEATWYHCTITCVPSGMSSVSDAIYVAQTPPLECYCEPTYTTGTGFGDYLENVTLGAINNTTGAGPAPYYTYFAGMSTDLDLEGTYTLYATVGTYSFNDVAAWIDYNHDGVFDEVTEKLGQVDNLAPETTGEITFTVPATAMTGTTRLRVREADQAATIEACETLTFGETEDYDVNIIPSACPMVTGMYVDGITENDAVLHWTGVDGADQYRIVLWNTATGLIAKKGVGATEYALTDNLTPLTTYAFRIKTVCLAEEDISAPTDWVYWTTLGRSGDMSGAVSVYPNPTAGTLNIQMFGIPEDNYAITVYDAVGNIALQPFANVLPGNNVQQVDLSSLPAGIYQVRIFSAEYNLVYPVVLQY